MEWLRVRSYFAKVFEASGLTQQAVADAGGLPGQNAISRVLQNDNLGPSVETFLRAVRGCGIDLSQFFFDLEYQEALEHGHIDRAPLIRPLSQEAVPYDRRIPQSGDRHPRLDHDAFEAMVRRQFAELRRELRSLRALDEGRRSDDADHDGSSAVRAVHRRRTRKSA